MKRTTAFLLVILGLSGSVACTAPGSAPGGTAAANAPGGAAGAAQDVQANFWLKGNPNNIQGCIAFDPQFTREHTFRLKNGQAEITSPGGLNILLSLVRPGVYQTRLQMGALNMLVTANLAARPKTLTVQDSNLGCAWSAVNEQVA
jgi:hypothetical protein